MVNHIIIAWAKNTYSLNQKKQTKFGTFISISGPRPRPRAEKWKFFTTSDVRDILNWYVDNVKLHSDSSEYSKMIHYKDWDEKASTFKNHEGTLCQGVQLANLVKNKRSKFMAITKPYQFSGSGSLDKSTLNAENLVVYEAFQQVFGDKMPTRYDRLVKSNNVSKQIQNT